MRTLPDTSAYSRLALGHLEIRRSLEESEGVVFSPIVLGELRTGFLKGTRRKENEQDLQRFLALPSVEIVAIDQDTSECYAEVQDALRRAGTPIPTNDIWIAATAMQHGLRVLTTDAHFRSVPQILVDLYSV